MFTQEQLLQRRVELVRRLVPVTAELYQAVEQPECGEARVVTAAATVTRDAMQFWVSAKAAAAGGRKYLLRQLEHDLCRPIALREFNELVATHFGGLRQPQRLPLHAASGFVGALQMAEDWNEVSALGAWTDGFVAFFWMTDA